MKPCPVCHSNRIPCECWYVNQFGSAEDKYLFTELKKLVKEAAMEIRTVTIKHPYLEKVSNVVYKKIILLDEATGPNSTHNMFVEGWMSKENGCLYLKSGGWEEVPPKCDVTEEVEIIQDGQDMKLVMNDEVYLIPKGFEVRKVQAVVLSEGMSWGEWANTYYHNSALNLYEVLEKQATSAIKVWREGE